MSTHRFIPAKRKGKRLPLLFMLGGLLLLFPLLLPATALAAPRSVRGAADSPPLTTPQIVDLAGVSVVRLSLTYSTTPNHRQVVCTALGTILASWPQATPTDKNTWVVTDGSLLSTSKSNGCTPAGGSLSSIEVLASNAFTNEQPAAASLVTLSCSSSGTCTDTLNHVTVMETILPPANGAILFSFRLSGAVPYLPVEAPTTSSSTSTPIALVDPTQNNALPTLVHTTASPPLTQYLTPFAPSLSNTTTPGSVASSPTTTVTATASGTPGTEAGTPTLDGNGNLTSMLLSNGKTVGSTSIQTLESQIPLSSGITLTQKLLSNTVNPHWDTGIRQFEQRQYQNAITSLQAIHNAPPAFQAPTAFIQQAQQKLPPQNTTPGSASGSNKGSNQSASSLFIIGLIAGVLALILLFVLVSIRFGRKRVVRKRELASFEADVSKARERVEGKEKPVTVPQQYSPSPPFYAGAVNNYPPPAPAAPPPVPAVSEMRCPQCGTSVEEGSAFCPNCRYNFASPGARYAASAIVPPVPAQLSPVQPLPASISDMPTTEMRNRNGSLSPDEERTMPFSVEQLQRRNLGLVVITETDPGIKRKHKPNEDSLFAMQGARLSRSQPQHYGLFVVADGMGGHANGQDASRTAIQHIIDFMLPRLAAGDDLNDEGYKALLVEGVQQANLAVHQRNLQDHADMGTTMTAALVVGSTAYVANVGDSRTYLYREPEGLRQITHDHSVVASLVEAGIIKPDDIYTHPKRNQIYRSLGEKPGVEVDAFIQPLQSGDKLLLCSDGLWDMVRDPLIQQVVRSSLPELNQIAKNLVKAALDGGGEDNVSVIVVSITDEAGQPAMADVHLYAKPDTVTVPEM